MNLNQAMGVVVSLAGLALIAGLVMLGQSHVITNPIVTGAIGVTGFIGAGVLMLVGQDMTFSYSKPSRC